MHNKVKIDPHDGTGLDPGWRRVRRCGGTRGWSPGPQYRPRRPGTRRCRAFPFPATSGSCTPLCSPTNRKYIVLYNYLAVLRIRDVYPRYWIRIFSIPAPGSRIRIKEFKYFHPKNCFLYSRKYDQGCFIPDPNPDFLPIPDPASRGKKGTGSRIRIRNTDFW